MIEFITRLKEFCMDIVPYGYRIDISVALDGAYVGMICLRLKGDTDIVCHTDGYIFKGGSLVIKNVDDVIEEFARLIPDYKYDKKMKFNAKCEALV